jgi:hypothetical protein
MSFSTRRARPYRRRSDFLFDHFWLAIALGALIVVVVGCVFYQLVFYQQHSATVTVCSKERAAKSGGAEYRVYTADHGTFVVKDMRWFTHWRTNSADFYGTLHPPATYDIDYVGRRVGLFSWFPNITSIRRAAPDQAMLAKCND